MAILGILISTIGCIISWSAYKYAKQANEDTNNILKNSLSTFINSSKQDKKEEIKNRLIETALSEWKIKGQPRTFLLNEYSVLEKNGWTKEEFEELFSRICKRYKGREPKSKLFKD